MKKIFRNSIITVVFVLMTMMRIVYADPIIEWNKTFGITSYDELFSVKETFDKNYIVAGKTAIDAWLIRFDKYGNLLWSRTYDIGYDEDNVRVIPIADGYILEGTYLNNTYDSDIFVIKTDKLGKMLWSKTYGGPTSELTYDIIQTADKGFVIAGGGEYFSGDFNGLLLKIDKNGTKLWNKTFSLVSEGKQTILKSVRQTLDHGLITTGQTRDNGIPTDGWLIKTDQNGKEQWNKTFDYDNISSDESECEELRSIQVIEDGFIIIGVAVIGSDEGGICKAWLIKTDQKGNEQWNRTYNNLGPPQAFQRTEDKGYIIIAPGNFKTSILLKLDRKGNEEWNKTIKYGDATTSNDVIQTTDGSYVIAGTITSNINSNINFYFLPFTDGFIAKICETNQTIQINPNIKPIIQTIGCRRIELMK